MLSLWLVRKLDPQYKLWHKFWSIRVAIFWGIMSGLWVAIPAFQGWLPPVSFALICVVFSVIMVVARLTKQPGLE